MAKLTFVLLVPLVLAACSPEHPPTGRNAAGESAVAEEGEANDASPSTSAAAAAASSGAVPRLARLKDSAEGDAAAHEGTLEVVGRCIFVGSNGSRSLIASTVPGARWDAARGVLLAGGEQLRPGARILLSGSFAPTANLRGQWVEPPAEECVTARSWIASAIKAR